MYSAVITGTAYNLPDRIVDNVSLSETYAVPYLEKNKSKMTPERIEKVCGIRQRHHVTDERLRDLAANCIADLLDRTGTELAEVDALIIGTLSPESYTPSTACLVLKELDERFGMKAGDITAYDTNAACCGFVFGVEQAANYIRLGQKKKIIVCGVEIMSRMLNGWDYHTGILFGDGAGAVLLERSEDGAARGILDTRTACCTSDISDIAYYSSLSQDFEKRLMLDGHRVYRHGTKLTIEFTSRYFSEQLLTVSDFDHFIFHQANIRMLDEISRQMFIPQSKMRRNLEEVGNTAAASIPICLAQANESGLLKSGDRILMCSFGAGYAVGLVDLIW